MSFRSVPHHVCQQLKTETPALKVHSSLSYCEAEREINVHTVFHARILNAVSDHQMDIFSSHSSTNSC